MIDPGVARSFLDGHRIAVVGCSDDPKNFGGAVVRALLDHGYDAVPVNPGHVTVADRVCHPSLREVPGRLDGVIVMVPGDVSADVVRDAVAIGVDRVWLFKGIGGAGAASDEALAVCAEHGVEVVGGACPLMFLEPVRGAHRFHRAIRRLNHSVGAAR